MAKLIRPTYPKEFSIGMLALIFAISCFLSIQLFNVPFSQLDQHPAVFLGMFLAGSAVVVMVLIIWEEFLFPIKLKEIKEGMVFRNHRTKLKTQLLIYCTIPAIFTFIYLDYDVNHTRFFIWAAICILAPVIEKIASGINNYNDFLTLTNEKIEYKNNDKEGSFLLKDIKSIKINKDERNIIKNIQLIFFFNNEVIIDLDEMELDAYYDHINEFITTRYTSFLVKEPSIA